MIKVDGSCCYQFTFDQESCRGTYQHALFGQMNKWSNINMYASTNFINNFVLSIKQENYKHYKSIAKKGLFTTSLIKIVVSRFLLILKHWDDGCQDNLVYSFLG